MESHLQLFSEIGILCFSDNVRLKVKTPEGEHLAVCASSEVASVLA